MKSKQKILIILSSLLLATAFVFPIWRIKIHAPQYPESLGLYINVNSISGEHGHDLQTINDLNHYIGMKRIVPESIPELKLMPYLIIGLLIFGVAAGWSGRRWLVRTWITVFTGIIVAGLVDFWMWEYDYGHNLDPMAPIKVPGMSYQPPLLGSKQLLNINATSLPYIAGVAVIIAFLIGAYITTKDLYDQHRHVSV